MHEARHEDGHVVWALAAFVCGFGHEALDKAAEEQQAKKGTACVRGFGHEALDKAAEGQRAKQGKG